MIGLENIDESIIKSIRRYRHKLLKEDYESEKATLFYTEVIFDLLHEYFDEFKTEFILNELTHLGHAPRS